VGAGYHTLLKARPTLLYNQSMPKQRLDNLLVARGLAANKSKAQALIMAGEVKVDSEVITKPGSMVDENASLELTAKLPFVSRGGIKLAHALDEFKLGVTSLTAMDVGASTGGFTDCLLQAGATRVYALDVGRGQLAESLRQAAFEKLVNRYSTEAVAGTLLDLIENKYINIEF